MTDRNKTSGERFFPTWKDWTFGIVTGLTLTAVIGTCASHYEDRTIESKKVIKENIIFNSSIPLGVKHYYVSDSNRDEEADTVCTSYGGAEEVFQIGNDYKIYRKGDSDFERILNEAQSARTSNEEGRVK